MAAASAAARAFVLDLICVTVRACDMSIPIPVCPHLPTAKERLKRGSRCLVKCLISNAVARFGGDSGLVDKVQERPGYTALATTLASQIATGGVPHREQRLAGPFRDHTGVVEFMAAE